ncbi:hypothetical protein C1646_762846 [Rhizophagus diaphanus]|nr:hypothetical protein C1646_762846 [Rhizophagus diaphanus] [Rhizophagus sp. MUCL 43196]
MNSLGVKYAIFGILLTIDFQHSLNDRYCLDFWHSLGVEYVLSLSKWNGVCG